MIDRIKKLFTVTLMFITAFGLIGFSLFILEESEQAIMFGTWQAISAQHWNIVLEGADLIENVNITLKIINYSVGWINPLSFLSYRAYGRASDYYIKALKSRIFAHAPELFVGRQVRFNFTPKQIRAEADHARLINGKLHVIVEKPPDQPSLFVQGVLQQREGLFIIDTTSK